MATGIAIMGFGGGALIASPWSSSLLTSFGGSGHTRRPAASPNVPGDGHRLRDLHVDGVAADPVPADDWVPAGWDPSTVRERPLVTTATCRRATHQDTAVWLLWVVLCFNVTAGIGILERAAPIYQDFFRGDTPAKTLTTIAAGFVAILSLANMLGRFICPARRTWSAARTSTGCTWASARCCTWCCCCSATPTRPCS